MSDERATPGRRAGRAALLPTSPGSAPGEPVFEAGSGPSRIHLVAFGDDALVEESGADLSVLDVPRPGCSVVWIDVLGLGDETVVRGVADRFGLHPLTLEDVVHTVQRPKLDDYDEHLFVVTRLPSTEGDSQQISIVLGDAFVITFQERPGDVFEPVRERVRRGRGRFRSAGADYVFYALLDAATDTLFPVLETYIDRLDDLEGEVVQAAQDPELVPRLHELRRQLSAMRRWVWPLRELLGRLVTSETPWIRTETTLFLRDCHDHAGQALDALDDAREQATGLVDVTLAVAGQKLNEVMKILTIMASIFIPLTFIAGIYGMNFDPQVSTWNMPLTRNPLGYPIVLVLMVVIAGALVIAFRRRGWLGERRRG